MSDDIYYALIRFDTKDVSQEPVLIGMFDTIDKAVNEMHRNLRLLGRNLKLITDDTKHISVRVYEYKDLRYYIQDFRISYE